MEVFLFVMALAAAYFFAAIIIQFVTAKLCSRLPGRYQIEVHLHRREVQFPRGVDLVWASRRIHQREIQRQRDIDWATRLRYMGRAREK